MKKLILSFLSLLLVSTVNSWSGDVLVGPLPSGKISMVSNSASILYCSIPSVTTGQSGVGIYQSTDMGNTWTVIGNPAVSSTVVKSKMLITGTDSVYCMYQVNNNLFVYSIASTITTPFTTITVDDFDVVASPNSNSLYLYCDDFGNRNIHRYSSSDGGYTWTGSTALVAGQSACPRLYMTGTRLIVNYYGPVTTDSTTSVIRGAFYNETAPGQITPGSFVDLVPAGVHRGQFSSVIVNGYVWMVYTEGDNSQSINCVISNDDGASYGSPVTLVSNTNLNARCFDAIHYDSGFESGMMLIYYTDSLNASKKFQFIHASTASPSLFSAPDLISDYEALCADNITPSLAIFGNEVGAVFAETNSGTSSTYFDKNISVTGISEPQNNLPNVYPNPTQSFLNIIPAKNSTAKIYFIYDLSGRILKRFDLRHEMKIDLSDFEAGVYYLSAEGQKSVRILKN